MSDARTVPRLTPEEINDLARRIVTNEVFITNTEEGYRHSFGLLLMFAEMTPEFTASVGAMYAPLAEAGPRSINGYPFFFGGSFVHRDDLDALMEKVEEKKAALA